MGRHVIDCSVQPMIPDGWRIDPKDQIASRFTGQLVWSPEKVRFYLDPAQQGDGVLTGDALQKKIEDRQVLPANVLDYLIQHPALIPSGWKGKYVYFWGTVYRGVGGYVSVRFLYWDGRAWRCGDCWLGLDWDGQDPSAVLAG